MAHFYGIIRGNRGEVTRMGSKASGFRAVAASWQGAISVQLTEENGVDWAYIRHVPWHGRGVERVIYSGPVAPKEGSSANDHG